MSFRPIRYPQVVRDCLGAQKTAGPQHRPAQACTFPVVHARAAVFRDPAGTSTDRCADHRFSAVSNLEGSGVGSVRGASCP
jgi:hypothetical protein